MPTTNIRGRQILDGDVARVDLNTGTSSSAVIRKLLPASDASITLTSTGVDAGTGDVTLVTAKATASQLGVIRVGSGLSVDANGILSTTGGGGTINGSGSNGYVPKFTDVATIGNSLILDNGSGVSIFSHPSFVYRFNVQGFSGNFISFWSPTINGSLHNGLISHNGTGFGGQTPMGYNATTHVFNGEVTGGGTVQVAGDVNISGTFRVNGTAIGTGGGGVSGSGTTGYVSLWSSGSSLTNARISQDSSKIYFWNTDSTSSIWIENYFLRAGNVKFLATSNILHPSFESTEYLTSGYALNLMAGTNASTDSTMFTTYTTSYGSTMKAFAKVGSRYHWLNFGWDGDKEMMIGANSNANVDGQLSLGASRFGFGYYSTLFIKWNTISLPNIPTSSSGLSSGDIYRDGSGYLRIV